MLCCYCNSEATVTLSDARARILYRVCESDAAIFHPNPVIADAALGIVGAARAEDLERELWRENIWRPMMRTLRAAL